MTDAKVWAQLAWENTDKDKTAMPQINIRHAERVIASAMKQARHEAIEESARIAEIECCAGHCEGDTPGKIRALLTEKLAFISIPHDGTGYVLDDEQ